MIGIFFCGVLLWFDSETLDFIYSYYRTSVWCHVPNCNNHFDTVFAYENHYNAFHRYLCSQCRKQLPSAHLLDLHLSEKHDSYFAAQAERKPMVISVEITRQIEFNLRFLCVWTMFWTLPITAQRCQEWWTVDFESLVFLKAIPAGSCPRTNSRYSFDYSCYFCAVHAFHIDLKLIFSLLKQYACYLEQCLHKSQTPNQRRDHCITEHKFPHDFRFDSYNYPKNVAGKKKGGAVKANSIDSATSSAMVANNNETPDITMDKNSAMANQTVADNSNCGPQQQQQQQKRGKPMSNFSFGQGQTKTFVFNDQSYAKKLTKNYKGKSKKNPLDDVNMCTDLLENLPPNWLNALLLWRPHGFILEAWPEESI